MKRYTLFAVLLLFIVTAAWAASSRITINPSEMKDGETKTFTDDDRKVTVKRDGDTTHVTIEGAKGTRTLSITSAGGDIRIERDGTERRKIVIDGDRRPRVLIDGMDVMHFAPHEMLPRKAQTWFVCPKDKAMLRVPEEKADESFKCPIDGTTMEKKKGRGFAFFFDDGAFESHDL
jgi:biopolymer transport protein ExbD